MTEETDALILDSFGNHLIAQLQDTGIGTVAVIGNVTFLPGSFWVVNENPESVEAWRAEQLAASK